MAKKKKTSDFHGNTTEYLEHLETEEKRSRMLADLESNPVEKKKYQIKNRQLQRLIQWVKRAMHGGIETADRRSMPDFEKLDQYNKQGDRDE